MTENEELMAQNLVEILHNNPDFMEFSEQTMKKIILGEEALIEQARQEFLEDLNKTNKK